MAASDVNSLRREIDEQARQVQSLQVGVFSQADPSENSDLLEQLATQEEKLQQLTRQLADAPRVDPADDDTSDPAQPSPPHGRLLGPRTTGLRVEPTLRMEPLPTGAYHLMDPKTDPLLTVEIENVSREIRRVCVKTFIEGLSATAVRTIEIDRHKQVSIDLQPTLLPDRAAMLTEVQRATLHLIVEDLDGKTECHDTFTITCLARTASFNSVRRPDTGELVDLSHYYGAWVTPHTEPVQQRVRRAVELMPQRQMMGYQGDPELVDGQVAALYQSLREAEIVYVNSVIDFGAPAGLTTQRTRLPRESLTTRSANCIDGTVLLASMLEGISLNPAIVLVPGHALVGWELWHGADEWRYLETTMIGTAEFDDACHSGRRQMDQFEKFGRSRVKQHSLRELRQRGIWPME